MHRLFAINDISDKRSKMICLFSQVFLGNNHNIKITPEFFSRPDISHHKIPSGIRTKEYDFIDFNIPFSQLCLD